MWQQRKVFTCFIVNTRINNGETGVCGEPCLLSGFIPGPYHHHCDAANPRDG